MSGLGAVRALGPVAAVCLSAAIVNGASDVSGPAVTWRVADGQPANVCLDADDPDPASLLDGRRRPVLVVYSYKPPTQGSGSLEVTFLVTGDTTRIRFFPGEGFTADTAMDAQRFYLPFTAGLGASELCYAISMSGGAGGSAEIALELSPELQP